MMQPSVFVALFRMPWGQHESGHHLTVVLIVESNKNVVTACRPRGVHSFVRLEEVLALGRYVSAQL